VLQPGGVDEQPPNGVCNWHCDALHVTPTQNGLRHAISHAHDSPQLTLRHESTLLQLTLQAPVPQVKSRHEPLPAQSTLHGPAPQLRFRQLCAPLHVIVQDLLLTQLMPLVHALMPEHAMLQLQPAGHVTCCLQAAGLTAQSMVQLFVVVSHEVHCDGHADDWASVRTPESSCGATQRPSLQVRPSAQSDCLSQVKSPLRWLTEQPPAVTAANPTTTSQSATSFTAGLRS
jgi:hypothetical protein